MKKIHTVIILIAILALGAIIISLIASSQGDELRSQAGGSSSGEAQNDSAQAKEDAAAIQSVPTAARYTNAKYGFSFEKPEGYTVGIIRDDLGEMLLVQKTDNGKQKIENSGFQIYITPIDAPMTLTPNLIKSDLPGTSVNSPLEISLDGRGKGIMFASNNVAFGGASYEIWFVYPNVAGGYLYQITSYQSFATQLKTIIGTWKFN